MTAYQPKTGAMCSCRRGPERDNCPHCEGTGRRIDFKAIRERKGEFRIRQVAAMFVLEEMRHGWHIIEELSSWEQVDEAVRDYRKDGHKIEVV